MLYRRAFRPRIASRNRRKGVASPRFKIDRHLLRLSAAVERNAPALPAEYCLAVRRHIACARARGLRALPESLLLDLVSLSRQTSREIAIAALRR
jgi:hypothetical protein